MIEIDKKECTGCGTCTATAPEVFELGEDGKASVKKEPSNKSKASDAADLCPADAIKIK